MKFKITFFGLILLLNGCAAITQVKPVNLDTARSISKVCVENNPKVIVGNLEDIIVNRLIDNNIKTVVYNKDSKPEDCQYTLKYVAYQKWDMTMVLTHAEIRLFDKDNLIGYAEYHLQSGGLLNPAKYKSNRDKINPLIDQVLGK